MTTQSLVSVEESDDSMSYNVILVAQSDMGDEKERKTRAKDALKLELKKADLRSKDVGGKPYVGNGPGLDLARLATQLHEFQKQQEERFTLQEGKITSQCRKIASQEMTITSLTSEFTSQKKDLDLRKKEIASQGQRITSQDRKITSQNQKIASQGQRITSQDRKIASQEMVITSNRAEFSSQKREIALQSKKIISQSKEIIRQGKVISSHKERFNQLRVKLTMQQEEITGLRNESLTLRSSLKEYVRVRNRFISTFKRDKLRNANSTDLKIIRDGNMMVHGGDVLVDAMLYLSLGERKDTDTFVRLYGLEPSLVSQITYGPTIAALNTYAYIISSLHKSGTEDFAGYSRSLLNS